MLFILVLAVAVYFILLDELRQVPRRSGAPDRLTSASPASSRRS
jgi:hypothetical protein